MPNQYTTRRTSSASSAPPAVVAGRIDERLNALHTSVAALRSAICALADRLDPVLLPEPTDTTTYSSTGEEQSRVAHSIESAAVSVLEAQHALERLTSRLDL